MMTVFKRTLASLLAATVCATAQAQDHSTHGSAPETQDAPAPARQPDAGESGQDHEDHAMHGMDQGSTDPMDARQLSGFSYGSGTARLPGADGGMHGIHAASGGWTLMAHGQATALYTDHKGPRGDDMLYATSMLMLSGERDTGWGRVALRTMVSLEPLMDARGYPNLFATGETAHGQPIVDRQHPHDFFMELAARIDINAGSGSLFLYGGPVGEPALGPSAFIHRGSAKYNPEPPVSHHWFDSTHITYGVVTAGYAANTWQIEASAFRGREPDEARWGIETPRLDSWSVRASFNPSPHWSLQLSHGFIKEPESGHAAQNEHRTTASVHYSGGGLAATAAFSAKDRAPGDTLTAWLAELTYDLADHHSLFGRLENVANDELVPDHHDPLHDEPFRITKAQLGYAWHSPIGTGPVGIALGASVNLYGKPFALDRLYGSNPWGYSLFARLSLGH